MVWLITRILPTICITRSSDGKNRGLGGFIPWPLQWRHNVRDSVSYHQPHNCLLNRLFRRRSKKSSGSPAFMRGIISDRWFVPHKGPVTRKMFHLMTSSWHTVFFLENTADILDDFSANTNIYIYTYYITAQQWDYTNGWHPSSCKPAALVSYIITVIAADGLATKGARASAVLVLD